MSQTGRMTNSPAAVTIDFELFHHTPAYRNAPGELTDDEIGLSAADYLLDTLATNDVDATYFVVGEVGEDHPETVNKLSSAGHEIASHTYSHRRLPTLDKKARRREIIRSREVLQEASGQDIDGFRAPAFEVAEDHFVSLQEAGYRYDSSLIPARSIFGWYNGAHQIDRPCLASSIEETVSDQFKELPVSVMPWLRLPLTGAWLRFFGPKYTIAGMKLLARRGVPPILYVHPWEFVELPEVRAVPKRVYWRTGSWMRTAFETILSQSFDFTTAKRILEDWP